MDLPGYGYAKAGKKERASFRSLIELYLEKRAVLAGVVWLLDSRREPSPDDFAIEEILAARSVPVLAVLTKMDKLTKRERAERAKAIQLALGLESEQLQTTSSSTGDGIAELAESILAAVGAAGQAGG